MSNTCNTFDACHGLCCKSNSQHEWPHFDTLCSKNVLTDFDKTWNNCRGYDHTCKSVWRCDKGGGLDERLTCHIFWFLIIGLPFNFFLGMAPSPHGGPLLTFCTSYMTSFRARKSLFGVMLIQYSPFWGRIPKINFWDVIGIFKPNLQIL